MTAPLTPAFAERLLKAIFYFLCVLSLVVDFFPHTGSADFRYTGADPFQSVLNLGLPTTFFIYDPRSGLHNDPLAFPLVGLEVIFIVILAVLRWRIGKSAAAVKKAEA